MDDVFPAVYDELGRPAAGYFRKRLTGLTPDEPWLLHHAGQGLRGPVRYENTQPSTPNTVFQLAENTPESVTLF